MLKNREFTSSLSRGEAVAVLLWLPVHLVLLPRLLQQYVSGQDVAGMNVLYFSISALYLVFVARRFLRRDFDPLCDRFGWVMLEVAMHYGALMLFNLLAALVVYLVAAEENPNNAAIFSAVTENNIDKMTAAVVLLAPLVEELLFRAGIFGSLRGRSRVLAYVVSILAFAFLHVWKYALQEPIYWLYLLQYLAPGFLLAHCYERSNSLWGSVILHAFINLNSLYAMLLMQDLEEMMRAYGLA